MSEIILISIFPNHVCSNNNLFELPNRDIISFFRAIDKSNFFDKDIKSNSKLGGSMAYYGWIRRKNLNTISDNFDLAEKLDYSKRDAYRAVYCWKIIVFFEPFIALFQI